MRLASWNVNGLRAVVKKDFAAAYERIGADVLCLQETKAQREQVLEALECLQGVEVYANSAQKKGYSGTAMICRTTPQAVEYDMGIPEHDQEGRVIAARFPTHYLVTVYTPNSGDGLRRLEYRQQWDRDFLAYLKSLEKDLPVLVCGDLNVAHRDIDLARPKANYNKNPGYMQQEIDGLNNLLAAGFVDTFRHLYPETVRYSWWSMRAGARERNVGWRIDYFLSSPALVPHIRQADILCEVQGSDHCPVTLELELPTALTPH